MKEAIKKTILLSFILPLLLLILILTTFSIAYADYFSWDCYDFGYCDDECSECEYDGWCIDDDSYCSIYEMCFDGFCTECIDDYDCLTGEYCSYGYCEALPSIIITNPIQTIYATNQSVFFQASAANMTNDYRLKAFLKKIENGTETLISDSCYANFGENTLPSYAENCSFTINPTKNGSYRLYVLACTATICDKEHSPYDYVDFSVEFMPYMTFTKSGDGGTLVIYDGGGNSWSYNASNNVCGNAQSDVQGGLESGVYDFYRLGNSGGSLGEKANWIFDYPYANSDGISGGERGIGVHAGRSGEKDGADRFDYKYCTFGCIRTTQEGQNKIHEIMCNNTTTCNINSYITVINPEKDNAPVCPAGTVPSATYALSISSPPVCVPEDEGDENETGEEPPDDESGDDEEDDTGDDTGGGICDPVAHGNCMNNCYYYSNFGTCLAYCYSFYANCPDGGGGGGSGQSCTPPASGDWVVTQSCTFTGNATALANVIVDNNSVLTIDPSATLNIDFDNHYLLIRHGSGVLIKDGGKIY